MNEIGNNVIEGHYSTETKVKRPQITVAEAPNVLPNNVPYSEKEAKQKIRTLNTDIYEGAKKEKAKHDFNKVLYFKIFGGVVLVTAGIAGINKISKFFRKS